VAANMRQMGARPGKSGRAYAVKRVEALIASHDARLSGAKRRNPYICSKSFRSSGKPLEENEKDMLAARL